MDDHKIPRPDPKTAALFENTNRNSLLFLRAAKIEDGSDKHKIFKATIQALHRQYLHPFKYVEEQVPDHVEQLIAKAQTHLPWLHEYEDCWPARIYLKRYVDTRRPHLMRTRYAHTKKNQMQTSKPSHKRFATIPGCKNPDGTLVVNSSFSKTADHLSPIKKDDDRTVRKFLASLTPSLEHHLDAFVELGIKDQVSLQAFLSWPQAVQAQFLDEGHAVLQLSRLEQRALLVDCGVLSLKALQRSHVGKLASF